jgi:hypothetical protein
LRDHLLGGLTEENRSYQACAGIATIHFAG